MPHAVCDLLRPAQFMSLLVLSAGPRWTAAQSCPLDSLVQSLNSPAPADYDCFGESVAISGNLALVGAEYDDVWGFTDAGSAYVFNATTGALVVTLNNPAPAPGANFGYSVAISGNLAVVRGANEVYVFNATAGNLVSRFANSGAANNIQYFGHSVAISGGLAVVGVFTENTGSLMHAGAAYVFNAYTGALQVALREPVPAAFDSFGYSVAISGDVVVVGAIGKNPAPPNPPEGIAYVFDANTGALRATLLNPITDPNAEFGNAVAVSGNLAVVGAFLASPSGAIGAGAAYVFDATTGAAVASLINPSPAQNDRFGENVAISGTLAVVGAPEKDLGLAGQGAAYVFDASNGNLLATITDPSLEKWGDFGWSVGISGNAALVCSPIAGMGAVSAGAAYVFGCPPPSPTPSPIPTPPPNAAVDWAEYE